MANFSAAAREERVAAIWLPFHDALAHLLDERRRLGRATVLVTVHSFTPVYRGVARPWHAGIITTAERRFADAVLAELRRDRSLVVGDNQPYSANDVLATDRDVAAWAGRLSDALERNASVGTVDAGTVDARVEALG